MDAVRYLATRSRTNLAIAVLDGLGLLDENEAIRPLNSPYARHFLDKLLAKPDPNQVVNAGEVIEQVAAGPNPVFKELRFKLEPEWVAVALIALVYDGQITLNLGGNETLDAGNLERAGTRAMADLADFRYYGRTRDVPLAVWSAIFDAFGLQSGLLREESTRLGRGHRIAGQGPGGTAPGGHLAEPGAERLAVMERRHLHRWPAVSVPKKARWWSTRRSPR